MGSENKSPFYQLSSSLVQEAVLCLFVRFARGCIGESASVYVAEKGIQSSFNMVMKNAKNHSQLNNQHPALGPWDEFESDVCFID